MEEVEEELLALLRRLGDAMDVLENLEEDNKPALVELMRDIVKSFEKLSSLEPKVSGTIPLDLIEQIDLGKNPDEYSKKIREEHEQQAKRGKQQANWLKELYLSLERTITDTLDLEDSEK